MKAANPDLIALLNSGEDFQRADLWTITLNGGSVVRWSGADVALTANGNRFEMVPVLSRSAISEKIGLEVATLELTITADSGDLINGTPIIPFIRNRGLDRANVKLELACFPNWGDPVTGTVIRFAGRVTSVNSIEGSTATVTVSSWAVLLNVNMPTNLYQAACLHSVYDSGCALNPASFASTGTVTGTPTASAFATSLSTTADDFAQGRIVFTSGANAGLAAAVRSNDGTGHFQLIRALPAVPAAGDTFTVYPGCDLTRSRCDTRFNNLGRRKATDFVPVPETIFGG